MEFYATRITATRMHGLINIGDFLVIWFLHGSVSHSALRLIALRGFSDQISMCAVSWDALGRSVGLGRYLMA